MLVLATLCVILVVVYKQYQINIDDWYDSSTEGRQMEVRRDRSIPSFEELQQTSRSEHVIDDVITTDAWFPSDSYIIQEILEYTKQEHVDLFAVKQYFHYIMTSITLECHSFKRFGNEGGGGYEICTDSPLIRPNSSCVVFSFGIRNDFSFDDAVSQRLGCTVHSFDPSMRVNDHARSERIFFHKIGLDGASFLSHFNTKHWNMYRFSDIRRVLGYRKTIDMVKMDIERSEWAVLVDILQNGEAVNHIRQLAIEVHSVRYKGDATVLSDYLYMLKVTLALEAAGFKKFLVHTRNNCCRRFGILVTKDINVSSNLCCYEVFYVNTRFT